MHVTQISRWRLWKAPFPIIIIAIIFLITLNLQLRDSTISQADFSIKSKRGEFEVTNCLENWRGRDGGIELASRKIYLPAGNIEPTGYMFVEKNNYYAVSVGKGPTPSVKIFSKKRRLKELPKAVVDCVYV